MAGEQIIKTLASTFTIFLVGCATTSTQPIPPPAKPMQVHKPKKVQSNRGEYFTVDEADDFKEKLRDCLHTSDACLGDFVAEKINLDPGEFGCELKQPSRNSREIHRSDFVACLNYPEQGTYFDQGNSTLKEVLQRCASVRGDLSGDLMTWTPADAEDVRGAFACRIRKEKGKIRIISLSRYGPAQNIDR